MCDIVTMDNFLRSCKVDSATEATHLSLVGGKYKIEDDKVVEFHDHYTTHYDKCFLMERVRYPGLFFIDVDNVDIETMKNILNSFLKNRFDCVVSLRQMDENNRIGMHINSSILVQSKEEATRLCTYYVGDQGDYSVYNTGLRMIGSNKKYDVKRVYFPCYEVQNGTLNRLEKGITRELVDKCSIHVSCATKERISSPQPGIEKSLRSILPPIRRTNEKGVHKSGSSFTLNLGFLNANYENVSIISKTCFKTHVTLFTRSRFCQNIQREHKSQHVYFVMDLKTKFMYQRCFCNGNNPDLQVQCEHFKSVPKKVPRLLQLCIHRI